MQPLNFISIDSDYFYSDFSVSGSFVYDFTNFMYFNSFGVDLSDSNLLSINGLTFDGREAGTPIYIDIEDNDENRFLYLDNQYINNLLYEYLYLNGVFDFDSSYAGFNPNFWDLINSYINIPVNIMSSFWSISIFNTGVTILTIFATFIAIIIAIKIGRYFICVVF